MEETVVIKETIFRKILNLIYRIWPYKKHKTKFEILSKFKIVLDDANKDDPEYDNLVVAAQLCQESLRIVRHRISLVSEITKAEEQMNELESYGKLTDEDVQMLKNLLNNLVSTTKDRNVLRYQLTDFDQSVSRMETLEEDANKAIAQIQDAEHLQRILRHDVGYLAGEKNDLEYERSTLEAGLDFINKFVIAVVVIMGIAAIYLAFLAMFAEQSIFLPTTILVLTAIIMSAVLYAFRRKVSYELKLNIKKQNRAVELLNKKNTVLAYYTNFLNYEYRKYQVRSSQMLIANIKEYGNYKYVTNRIDSIRNIMYETERQIELFLREKKIDSGRFTIEQFANTINIEDKQAYYKELEKQKSELEGKLADMDAKHQNLWKLLEQMNENDKSHGKIVGKLIKVYFEEVDKLFAAIDNQEEVV